MASKAPKIRDLGSPTPHHSLGRKNYYCPSGLSSKVSSLRSLPGTWQAEPGAFSWRPRAPSVWAEMTPGVGECARPGHFQGQGLLGCRREAEVRSYGVHVLGLRGIGRLLFRREDFNSMKIGVPRWPIGLFPGASRRLNILFHSSLYQNIEQNDNYIVIRADIYRTLIMCQMFF